jgi:hypothetical protein
MPHKDKAKRRAYHAEYMRKWRPTHPDALKAVAEKRAKHAAYMRAFWRTHPEAYAKHLERCKARRLERMATMSLDDRTEWLAHRQERQLARYRNNPVYRESQIAAQKALGRKIRAQILAGYGGKCACCAESEPHFLELDHVNGGGAKEFKAMKSAITLYRRVIAQGFPDRYRLLCANCNRGRYRNGGRCPHNREESD